MAIVLREMTREAADAILAGDRPRDVRVADDYPTEFSGGVAQCVGAERQFRPFLLHRSEDADDAGNGVRVKEWELVVVALKADGSRRGRDGR